MAECFSFFYLDNFEALSVVLFEFYCLYFLAERFDFGAVSVVPGLHPLDSSTFFLFFLGVGILGFLRENLLLQGMGLIFTRLHLALTKTCAFSGVGFGSSSSLLWKD